MASIIEQTLTSEIDRLKRIGLYRDLKKITGPIDTKVSMNGKEVILLSSNNYLGLANHPEMKKASAASVKEYGTGACASRLVAGNMEIHEELEKRIARFKGLPAIVFSTGYLANIGVLSSLMGRGDLVLSDELNHASVIDGCRLSGAEIKAYPHRDVKKIEEILSKEKPLLHKGESRNSYIVTDGVFSMDGDIAPLPELVGIAKKYNSLIILDDAHATGVLGENGRGTAEHFGLEQESIIQVGTLSKALGSLGGYVAGPESIIEYLRNKARSFIYSTALPPSVCAASIAALDIMERSPWIRKRLWKNVARFKEGLTSLGYNTMETQTQILPILIGDTDLTMEFSRALFERGVYAPGIRPPSVPQGKSRIRASVMASHTDEEIDTALEVLKDEGKRLRLI